MYTRSFVLIGILACASATAAPVVHDNSSATFVWTGNGSIGIPGGLFDPTLPPNQQQSEAFGPRQLATVVNLGGGGSGVVFADGITTASSIRLARNLTTTIVNGPDVGQQTLFRHATVFSVGAQVGPASNFEAINTFVPTGYFNVRLGQDNFLGQRAFVGFRVILNDGLFHYGWIELDYRESPVAIGPPPLSTRFMYQPISWAYETEPNTPITVVPGPMGAGVCVAAAVFALRRRRAARC